MKQIFLIATGIIFIISSTTFANTINVKELKNKIIQEQEKITKALMAVDRKQRFLFYIKQSKEFCKIAKDLNNACIKRQVIYFHSYWEKKVFNAWEKQIKKNL